jgi:hypothetical protein
MSMVNKEDWAWAIDFVKKQCTKVVVGLVFEFKRRFPTQKLFNAIGIIYPQYWLVLEAKTTIPSHMAIIQAHFGYRKALGKHGRFVGPLLDPILLDKQSFFWSWHCRTIVKPLCSLLMIATLLCDYEENLHQVQLWTNCFQSGLNWCNYAYWWLLVAWRMKGHFPTCPSWRTSFAITLKFTLILLWNCMLKVSIHRKHFHSTQQYATRMNIIRSMS